MTLSTKTKSANNKLKSFKEYAAEEIVNTSSGPGVNMNPTGKKTYQKLDRRNRHDPYRMYKKSMGLKHIPNR